MLVRQLYQLDPDLGPNDVRAAYRAAHQAVAAACSDPQHKGILDKVSIVRRFVY